MICSRYVLLGEKSSGTMETAIISSVLCFGYGFMGNQGGIGSITGSLETLSTMFVYVCVVPAGSFKEFSRLVMCLSVVILCEIVHIEVYVL